MAELIAALDVQTRAEAVPGLTEAMLCCKDADWGLERRLKSLKEKGELVDLCTNSSCEGEGDKIPEPYGVNSFRVKASIATKYGPNQFWVDDIHIYKLW